MLAYMKLVGSLDDRLMIWWVEAVQHGMVGKRSMPLFSIQVGRFQRFFRRANGTFALAMFELRYFTDLKTGRLLERFSNPYTGVINDVVHVGGRPIIVEYAPSGRFFPTETGAPGRFCARLVPELSDVNRIQTYGTGVAEGSLRFPADPMQTDRGDTVVTGRWSELADASTRTAPATLVYRHALNWQPWMRMDNHPGQINSWGRGSKLASPMQLPKDYLAMARAIHPWLIRDPVETLAVRVSQIRDSAPA